MRYFFYMVNSNENIIVQKGQDTHARETVRGKYDAESMALKFSSKYLKGEQRNILSTALNNEGFSLDDQVIQKGFIESLVYGLPEDKARKHMEEISEMLSDLEMITDKTKLEEIAKKLVKRFVDLAP